MKVKVASEVEDSQVVALEERIKALKNQRLQAKLEADTRDLETVNKRIEEVKRELTELEAKPEVDDSEIKELEDELEKLEGKALNLEIAVEEGKLNSVKDAIEDIDDTEIDVDVNNIAAMESIEQISQGFDRLKQGAREIGDELGEVLESAGKQEMNKTFLEMNLGPEKARAAVQDINDIVANMPGDDTALQGLLSQAAAKNANITKGELEGMATAATDYFSAMSFYGKSATEAQQDMTNYILTGNTAELQRSPILQAHIDKLKEGNSVQERTALLQEALQEEGWANISTQETYNNKLETFNGMLERGRYNLGGMFQEGAKHAMDFVLKLDESTNGMVGMGLALAGFASPLTDSIMGLGQMATGMKAIKDLGMIQYLKDLEIMTKLSAAADYILAGAQAVLNFVMEMNPIVLVVIALIALVAALIWAYQNVDWFREMVDNAWASLQRFGQMLVTNIQKAINQFSSAVQGIPKALKACLDWAYNLVMSHPVVQALIWLGNKAAEAFAILGLGQSSPGKIVKAMRQELDWTSEAIYRSNLADDTARLGAKMSESFNPSLTASGADVTGTNGVVGGGLTLNIEVGTVDSRDRVQEIVDAITREIAWDNTTAGRTV